MDVLRSVEPLLAQSVLAVVAFQPDVVMHIGADSQITMFNAHVTTAA